MANRNMRVDQEWEQFREALDRFLDARSKVSEWATTQQQVDDGLTASLSELRMKHVEEEHALIARHAEAMKRAREQVEQWQLEQQRAERQVRAAGSKLPGLVASVIAGALGKGSSEQAEPDYMVCDGPPPRG